MSSRQLSIGDFASHCLEEPTFGVADDAASQDFWHPLTASRQAELQHAPAVTSPESLLGDGTEEEWQGFDEALESWRSEQVITPLSAADFPHAARYQHRQLPFQKRQPRHSLMGHC